MLRLLAGLDWFKGVESVGVSSRRLVKADHPAASQFDVVSPLTMLGRPTDSPISGAYNGLRCRFHLALDRCKTRSLPSLSPLPE